MTKFSNTCKTSHEGTKNTKNRIGRPSAMLFFSAAVFLLTASLSIGAQDPQTQTAPDDGHSNFPAGDGRDITLKVCSTCHSVDIVAEQQMDHDGWQNMVDQMASMGAEATEVQLKQIVDYLTKAFPPAENK